MWRGLSSARSSTAATCSLNDVPVAGIAVQLLPNANALAVAEAVKARMRSLGAGLPTGVSWFVPYDSTDFILDLDPRSGEDADRGDDPGVHRDAGVSAEPARHADSDARRAGGADGRVHRHVCVRLHDQSAHAVWHGARHRHRGRRRHRGHRERRAHHARRETSPRQAATRIAMGQITGRHRRDHLGARRGLHSERAAGRQRRRHLPPVRAHHRGLDCLLGVSRPVVHARAVRQHPQGHAHGSKRLLPLVQPHVRLDA